MHKATEDDPTQAVTGGAQDTTAQDIRQSPAGDEAGPTSVCSKCGGRVDVTGLAPLAEVNCPHCHTQIYVLKAFGNYEILRELGRGGMGAVYRAFDRKLQRDVALKLMIRKKDGLEQAALVQREAEMTAAINHPHVVRVFATGEEDGYYFIAMEILPGGTLQTALKKRQRLTEIEVLRMAIQVTEGLQAAHAVGLLHRDIKPGNIMFQDDQTAKITDFGLALSAEDAAVCGRQVFGTAHYIAPERIAGNGEDVRSDIYSLGATLFHALAGRPPFEGDTSSIVAQKHVSQTAPPVGAFAPVSTETSRLIARALSSNPDARFGSYAELLEHLKHAQSRLMDPAQEPSSALSRKPRTKLLWAGAILLAGLCAFLGYRWLHRAPRSAAAHPPAIPAAAGKNSAPKPSKPKATTPAPAPKAKPVSGAGFHSKSFANMDLHGPSAVVRTDS